ncbi:MAG: YceI family protein [Myxococcota bacterium]
MPRFDPGNAECFVLTYVKGALSAVGHDLKLRVGTFRVDVNDEDRSIRATFDPASLRVENAMKRGQDAPGTLSEGDEKKIHRNVREDVLQPDRHPDIRFQSKSVENQNGAYRVTGDLTLHGQSRPISFDVRDEGERYETRITLQQPDFGIEPYKAAFGGLKVKPEVDVLFRASKG